MRGPFEVKFHGSRAIHKVWAIVFACMSTRSVHVELVHKSDADSLLQAISCFSARQPGTKHFVSDNGGNLTKADKLLKQELKEYNKTTVTGLDEILFLYMLLIEVDVGNGSSGCLNTI